MKPPLPAIAAAGGGLLVLRIIFNRERAGGALASEVVAAARRDLSVTEDLGRNDGHRIREYFEGSGITPPANWCAAATTTWIREAARRAGVNPPIAGSMQARKIGEQLAHLAALHLLPDAKWFTAEDVRRDPSVIHPGDVAVWDRSDPAKPETSWYGHVGVVAAPVVAGTFATIEGNSGQVGDRVAEMVRRIDDPKLIGVGRAWPPGQSTPARSTSALRRQHRPQGQFVEPAPDWDAA